MEEQNCSYIHFPDPKRYLDDNCLSASRQQRIESFDAAGKRLS